MAEIKNNFLKGRMNKDLDERLVSKGEYRDALNVEVSSSDGSNIGTAQNIKGNSLIASPISSNYTFTNAVDAEVVGVIADKPNDKMYYFVKNANNVDDETYNGNLVTLGLASDAIIEYDSTTDETDYIFVDVHTTIVKVNAFAGTTVTLTSVNDTAGIEPGMKVEAIKYDGLDIFIDDDVRVVSVNDLVGTLVISSSQAISQANIDNNSVVLRLTKAKLLNFSELNNRNITGINIIDGNILFTDGISEPKKININRSRLGTNNQYNTTHIVIEDPTEVGGYSISSRQACVLENITLIKQNPQEPPRIKIYNTHREADTTASINTINLDSYSIGDSVELVASAVPEYYVGDTLNLDDGLGGTATVVITDINSGVNLTCIIINISASNGAQTWTAELARANTMYENSFIRFAYRYIYQENEYSGYSPFSNAGFSDARKPQDDDFGVNFTKLLIVQNWVPPYIPEDVKAIEIVAKLDSAPQIYSIKKFDRYSDEFEVDADGSYNGRFVIRSEVFLSTIEDNQILRPWDAVPKFALAQEITGNRVLFGNYTQGYDLIDSSFLPINLDMDVSIRPYNDSSNEYHFNYARESVKSGRSYQVGVVYRDDLGRETPVLVSESSVIKADRLLSYYNNRIVAKIKSPAPYWATSYKFFVKDTTPVSYNVVIQNVYEVEDYWWIEFDSKDKDKIKEGDTLILKRFNGYATETQAASIVVENVSNPTAEYEVLSRSNEAPLAIDPDVANGKFWVKIKNDSLAVLNISNWGLGPENNKGVFEVKPITLADTDIYFEASQAYPIRMNRETCQQYIKVGSYVTGVSIDSSGVPTSLDGTLPPNTQPFADDGEVYVTNVVSTSDSVTETIAITLDTSITLTIPADGKILLRFALPPTTTQTGVFESGDCFVTAELAADVAASNTLYLKKLTHPIATDLTPSNSIMLPWYNCYSYGNGVELMSIQDSILYPQLSKGVKVSSIIEDYQEENISNGLIFSGIYNKKSSTNRLNQFIAAESITKDLSPEYGSIQKLHSRDTDVIALCEDKVLRVLANKDALYNADGNINVTSNENVLGQAIPYAGNYGISKNPESFADYGYRVYFADRARGSVLRLSRDGLTVISDIGMKDWFFDNLKSAWKVLGTFDDRKNHYNITVYAGGDNSRFLGIDADNNTISFNESSNGWESFKSFLPESGISLNAQYYTFKNGKLWLHRSSETRGNFYGSQYDATITTVFNSSPDVIKSFKTLNYEGSQTRVIQDLTDQQYYNNTAFAGWWADSLTTDFESGVVREFINKENKWFNYIHGANTEWTNDEGLGASGNIDTQAFSLQGVGALSIDSTGDAPAVTYSLYVNPAPAAAVSEFVSNNNVTISGLSGSVTPGDQVFTITPLPGYSIQATSVSVFGALPSQISGVTFTQSGSNVIGTITFNNFTASSNQTITFQYTFTKKIKEADVEVSIGHKKDTNEVVDIIVSGNYAKGTGQSSVQKLVYPVIGTPEKSVFEKVCTADFTADSGYYYPVAPRVEIKSKNLQNYRVIYGKPTLDGSNRIIAQQVFIEFLAEVDKYFYEGDLVYFNQETQAI